MQRILSIILSLLILLSSSGITYAQHFCGEFEMMAELSMGEKHLSCGMAMEAPGCEGETEDHDCCSNEYTSVEIDDTFTKASFELDLDTNFVIAFNSVFVLQSDLIVESHIDYYKDYSPPPLGGDLQVRYQTFLI